MAKRLTDKQREDLSNEIVARLASGETQRAVAKALNVPLGSVATYSSAAKSVTLVQKHKNEIGQKAYAYISATLDSLKAQAIYFGSREFLHDPERTTNAQGLAILHGISADKVIRLFEAYAGNPDDPV